MTDGPTRVFLLDDHEVVRHGLAALIDGQDDLEVVGQAGTLAGVVDAVGRCSPDVAVLDVRLPDGSGLEACREIRSAHPDVACLMLTSFADDRVMVDAALAGAAGFVLKEIRGDAIVEAIRKVGGGVVLLDAAEVRMATERLRAAGELLVDDLTPQEQRIFRLIGEGRTNREIADALNIAEKTVKNRITMLLAKLGMTRRTEVAAFAARLDERHREAGLGS
jgi:two-component system, NarL family, response regulator DevR